MIVHLPCRQPVVARAVEERAIGHGDDAGDDGGFVVDNDDDGGGNDDDDSYDDDDCSSFLQTTSHPTCS